MADTQTVGRPRQYASQSAFEELMGRVAALELVPPTPGVARPTPSDQAFVESILTALISSSAFTGGDSDLAPMAATVEAIVVARDVVMANLGVRREQRLRTLRENGSLSFANL